MSYMRIKELSSKQRVAEEFFPSYLNDMNLVYRWRQIPTGKTLCDKFGIFFLATHYFSSLQITSPYLGP